MIFRRDISHLLSAKAVWKMVIFIICLFVSVGNVSAREKTDSLTIFFRQGYGIYEPNFRDNRKQMDDFIERISALQNSSDYHIAKISYIYIASASPEGEYNKNTKLVQKRIDSISKYLHSHLTFGDKDTELILFNENYEILAKLVEASDMPYKDEVLEILRTQPLRVSEKNDYNPCKSALITHRNGASWKYMHDHLFPELRCFKMKVVLDDGVEQEPAIEYPILVNQQESPLLVSYFAEPDIEQLEYIDVANEELAEIQFQELPHMVTAEQTAAIQVAEMVTTPQLLVKTNAVGWGLAVSNLAVEVELSKHFSFNLPVYYSGINYFAENTKFRIFGVYPEFRYWFKQHDGFFVGAHAGFAYFNVALGKNHSWRIQDAGGTTPAMGGGLNFGYRMPLSKKHPRWKVEFSLGGGVYDIKYEKFVKEKDGPKAQGTFHNTVVALDNVGVSFSYSFDLKKRNR